MNSGTVSFNNYHLVVCLIGSIPKYSLPLYSFFFKRSKSKACNFICKCVEFSFNSFWGTYHSHDSYSLKDDS